MTSDISIWSVPGPSYLNRKEDVFIIGAQVDGVAFAESGPRSAFHRFTILSQLRKGCVILP